LKTIESLSQTAVSFYSIMSDALKTYSLGDSPSPASILIPDIAGYIRDIFTLKLNPYHEEAEATSLAWFDSYGTLFDFTSDESSL
jgi:hypothetical protein